MKINEYLGTMFIVEQEKIPEKGEDSFCAGVRENSAFVAVFDGSGGMGFRTYPALGGCTGAYAASRLLSGALSDWYAGHASIESLREEHLVKEIDAAFRNAYRAISPMNTGNARISGSMVRDFPTTAAIAFVRLIDGMLYLTAIWAGDSRVYLIDEKGMAQLTEDDVRNTDAFANLSDDGALSNVLALDGKFVLHSKTIPLEGPTIVLAATDGCFGYIPSPMEFEYLFLDTLVGAESITQLKNALKSGYSEIAADDFAMGFLCFHAADLKELQQAFAGRLAYLKKEMILPIFENEEEDLRPAFWNTYKANYERYFREFGGET